MRIMKKCENSENNTMYVIQKFISFKYLLKSINKDQFK